MSLKPTNDIADRTTAGPQSKHDAGPSRFERLGAGLKARQMMGYSLSTGNRRTRAVFPTKEPRGVDREIDFPACAAEMAIFARILELSDLVEKAPAK